MKPFCTVLFILIMASCRFSPDDMFFVERAEPVPPEIQVIELDLEMDTIFLAGFKDIRFHFSAGNHHILEVGILINGVEKYVRSNFKDNFIILASDLTEGYHKLAFTVTTNSNTGSIADMLGQEGFQFFSHEWTLVCVKPDERKGAISHKAEEGKMKLTWDRYTQFNFKSYLIAKRYHYSSAPVKFFRTKEPFLVDEAYVGEKAFYDVFVEYYGSHDYAVHWAEMVVEQSLPEIKIRFNDKETYEIYWENNAYAQAIGSYMLVKLQTPADTTMLWRGSPSGNNHYNIPGAAFGDYIDYILITIPEIPDKPFDGDDFYYHSATYRGMLGEKSFPYRQIEASGNNDILVLQDNYIYRFSVSDGVFGESLTYNWNQCGVSYGSFSLSPGKKFFTAAETCNSRLVLMEPARLSDYRSYPVSHILTGGMGFSSFPVSDNGIVIAKDYGGVHIYDVLNDKYFGSVPGNESVYATAVSSLGNYFAIKTSSLRFYKMINDDIIKVWESSPLYQYIYDTYAFDPQYPDHIILHDGKTLFHKNAADFSTIKSFPFVEENILNIDFVTRRLLAYSEGYLSVYAVDNGNLIFRTKANPRVNLSQHFCRLALDAIYLSDGICIRLPGQQISTL